MSTLNGCGTKFYGRSKTENGYITTKYIVLIYIPIIPLDSYFVISEEEGHNWIISSSTSYELVKLEHLFKPQLKGFLVKWSIVIIAIMILSLLK